MVLSLGTPMHLARLHVQFSAYVKWQTISQSLETYEFLCFLRSSFIHAAFVETWILMILPKLIKRAQPKNPSSRLEIKLLPNPH